MSWILIRLDYCQHFRESRDVTDQPGCALACWGLICACPQEALGHQDRIDSLGLHRNVSETRAPSVQMALLVSSSLTTVNSEARWCARRFSSQQLVCLGLGFDLVIGQMMTHELMSETLA